MTKLLTLFALLVLGFAPVRAAEEKPIGAASTIAPGKVFLPTELDALKPLIGQNITIEGKLVRQGGNKGQTIRYLNFTQNYRDSVALVFFVEKGGDAFAKEKLTEWLGRKVRATGKLKEFNENLQIEIEKMDQLKEITEAPQPAEPAKAP